MRAQHMEAVAAATMEFKEAVDLYFAHTWHEPRAKDLKPMRKALRHLRKLLEQMERETTDDTAPRGELEPATVTALPVA